MDLTKKERKGRALAFLKSGRNPRASKRTIDQLDAEHNPNVANSLFGAHEENRRVSEENKSQFNDSRTESRYQSPGRRYERRSNNVSPNRTSEMMMRSAESQRQRSARQDETREESKFDINEP